MWKRQKAKFYHNRHAKHLPELEIGQEVTVAPLRRNQARKQGTYIEKLLRQVIPSLIRW